MPPGEQYFGGAEPRSDIYALGATMHHLITGKKSESFQIQTHKRNYSHNNPGTGLYYNESS